MTKHGTISKYTAGCRCKACRAANAGYQRAYQARRRSERWTLVSGPGTFPTSADPAEQSTFTGPLTFTATTPIVAGSTIVATNTTTGAWMVDTRSPMERLVDACVDLREAFAGYYAAKTEPVS